MTPQWLDRAEYPFALQYFPVGTHRLHYIDEGTGDPILFVHGTPSWSFDFRHLIKGLRSHFRCLAIDHMGFGLSDKPAQYDYTTQNHSQTLTQFVLEKDLNNLTLVVHDFGGPIGLHFAMQHPERIKRLVILNSWMWSSEQDPEFVRFSRVLKSPLLPFLYKYFNFSPRFILPRSFGEQKLPKQILRQYTRPFPTPAERNGALTFAHSLLRDQAWFEALWESRHSIMHKPTLLIWGMKDPVIGPKYLDKFQLGFPHATALQLATCGHFPQEEQPNEVLAAMRQFLQS